MSLQCRCSVLPCVTVELLNTYSTSFSIHKALSICASPTTTSKFYNRHINTKYPTVIAYHAALFLLECGALTHAHTHTSTHTYTHAHIRTRTHTHTHTHKHKYLQKSPSNSVSPHIHTHTQMSTKESCKYCISSKTHTMLLKQVWSWPDILRGNHSLHCSAPARSLSGENELDWTSSFLQNRTLFWWVFFTE